MAERSGVFLLQNESLVPMEPAQFATEDDFQVLLARFPELFVGDQIDPQSPRRWILVRREQPVATGELGASQWSTDHLFLDQDGIPTLVEIKRQCDSRIRREVVGQMLDYAANCATHWSVDALQASFDKTCALAGQSVETRLSELLGADGNVGTFWQRVQTNLEAGNIRLLFVADVIPLELRRVVEFLNKQMMRTEVLAIELRQFSGQGLKTLIPTVYGQTQEGVAKRNPPGQTWDEVTLFEKLAATIGTKELQIAKDVYDWMRKGGSRPVVFGTGREDGSVYPLLKPAGVRINPIYLSSSGRLYLQFGSLQDKPVFGSMENRLALMQRLNMIQNVKLTNADLNRYPGIALSTIAADPNGVAKLMSALRWLDEQVGPL